MTMLTTRRGLIQGAAAAFVAAAFLIPQAASSKVTLNLSEVLPEGNWQTIELKKYASAVQEATNGEVVIRVHSGGALGFKGPEHLVAVKSGLVDMADLLLSQAFGEVPLFRLETLPFVVGSPDELKVLYKYLRPEWDKVAAKYNQKFLTTMMPSPTNAIFCKVKADNLDGLKGIKARGADMGTVATFNALGLTGIQIPWGELIPALATGRVEAVGTSPTSAVDGKFWEFMKYIYHTNHIWGTNVITINLDVWNDLPKKDQDAYPEGVGRVRPKILCRI